MLDAKENSKSISKIQKIESNGSPLKSQTKLDDESKKEISVKLIKESENYLENSKQKEEKAREYLNAANQMQKLADAVRSKAKLIREEKVEPAKAKDIVKEVASMIGSVLEMPVPKDADPNTLDRIADALEKKALENRKKADDLLRDAERNKSLAKELKQQVEKISKKEMNFTDLQLKSFAAHSEGLNRIYKMLGIMRLENEYKEQLSLAEKKIERS